MMLLLLYMFLTLLIAITIKFYLVDYNCFKDLKCDGPFHWPIIGNLLWIWDIKKLLKKLIKLQETYGKIIKFSCFGYNAIFIFDPEILNFVMNSTKFNEKGILYEHFKVWLSTGLLVSSGNKWKKRRKMLTPIFKFNVLRNCVGSFQSNGHVLTQKLLKHTGESFDIYPWICSYFLDVFSGTKMDVLSGCNTAYVELVEKSTKLLSERYENIFKFYDFTYKFTSAYCEAKECAEKIHEYAYKMIRERKSKIEHTNFEQVEFGDKNNAASLVDLLISSTIDGQPLSDEDIREEIDTFTFGGFDLASTATSFALYEIARNPKIQEEILQETLSILGKEHRTATYNDLQSMKYLEMVIKETLRLYPPGALFHRVVREDVKCDWGTIKANTNIIISPYVLHKMSEYFPNPYIFDPSRFSPENLSNITRWTYIPFSAGERNCIGQKFGMLAMKSTISQIVMKYKVLPDPNYVADDYLQVTLKPLNGVQIKLEKRF